MSKTTDQLAWVDPFMGIKKELGLTKLVSSLYVSPGLRGN